MSRFMDNRHKAVIYKLKRLFGTRVNLYRQGVISTNLQTGARSWSGRDALVVDRAIVLPVKIERVQTQSISYISSGKEFVYGGSYDVGKRWFYLDPKDLPKNYKVHVDDNISYLDNSGTVDLYEIETILYLEFEGLWEILGSKVEGVVPQQVHTLSAYDILDLSQGGSGGL